MAEYSINSGWGGPYGSIPWGGYTEVVGDPESDSDPGGLVTDDGIGYLLRRLLPGGDGTQSITTVVLGTGRTPAEPSDSSMERALDERTRSTVAASHQGNRVYFALDVTGGDDVPANSSITEFGLLSEREDTLVYRIVREPVIIPDGDTVRFEVAFDIGLTAGTLTNDGVQHLLRRAMFSTHSGIPPVTGIAVGTGTSSADADDSELEEPVRHIEAESIRKQDNGVYVAGSVTGGLSIEPGTELTEFGVYAEYGDGNRTLLTRDVRDDNPITVGRGYTKTIEAGIELNRVQT